MWHEANSFNPVVTEHAAFAAREWAKGDAAAALYRDTGSELAGALDALAGTAWQPCFLRCCAAPPGGPVAQALLDALRDEIVADLAAGGPWDAVYLSLHGACLGTEDANADLTLVEAVRRAIGPDVPLAVSCDLHANLDPRLAERLDILVGYKTYPHLDMRETGRKAVSLLLAAADGAIAPRTCIVKAGCLLLSHAMRTEAGPMGELEALAAGLATRDPRVLDATPFGGFAYGDSPAAGAAASVCVDGDTTHAQALARDLAAAIAARREAFAVALPGAEAGVAAALARLDDAREGTPGPVALLEPADNPLSGGIGDSSGLLRALVDARPSRSCVFAFFWDPPLVARCHALGEGAELTCRLGGRLVAAFGPPVALGARVERLTDGRFVNEGPMWTGLAGALGRTAVLRAAGADLRVIVTESCVAPNDPGYFRLHGIDLAALDLLCVKAKNHFRAAFAARCRAILEVDTPGPASADLAALPYRRLAPGLLPATPP